MHICSLKKNKTRDHHEESFVEGRIEYVATDTSGGYKFLIMFISE